MREWCSSKPSGEAYARTLIARCKLNKKVVGYGTIACFKSAYCLQPVYADNELVADQLLKQLACLHAAEGGGNPLLILFNASNSFMMAFSHRLGLERVNSLTRGYRISASGETGSEEIDEKYIRHDRVYAMQFYWPV